MNEETLRQLLARVHERLSKAGPIDSETRDLLATVMRDIDGALAKGAPIQGSASSAGAPGKAGVVPSVTPTAVSPDARVAAAQPRLEALAVRFEAEHPAIAQLLRQIGALLGQAGI